MVPRFHPAPLIVTEAPPPDEHKKKACLQQFIIPFQGQVQLLQIVRTQPQCEALPFGSPANNCRAGGVSSAAVLVL